MIPVDPATTSVPAAVLHEEPPAKTTSRGVEHEVRSEGVQEVLGRIPPWSIRFGNTVVLGLMVLLIVLASLIRYPDAMVGRGVLTTADPPRSLVAHSAGKLALLGFEDGAQVRAGDLLAVVESAADPAAMETLGDLLRSAQVVLDSGAVSGSALPELQLGEAQGEYAELRAAIAELVRWNTDALRHRRDAQAQARIALTRRMITTAEAQVTWSAKKMANSRIEAGIDTALAAKGFVHASEFRRKQNEFIDQQLQYVNMEKAAQQQRMSLLELEAAFAEQFRQDGQHAQELQDRARTSIARLSASRSAWAFSQEMRAPVSGRLHLNGRMALHDPIHQGDTLLQVAPSDVHHVFEAVLPVEGSGQVAVGAKVFVQLDAFPANEYGRLIGTVRSVAVMPSRGGYRLVVELGSDLVSSYGKDLPFTPAMPGAAEVIMRDRSILQRIVDRVRGAMDR